MFPYPAAGPTYSHGAYCGVSIDHRAEEIWSRATGARTKQEGKTFERVTGDPRDFQYEPKRKSAGGLQVVLTRLRPFKRANARGEMTH